MWKNIIEHVKLFFFFCSIVIFLSFSLFAIFVINLVFVKGMFYHCVINDNYVLLDACTCTARVSYRFFWATFFNIY